MRIRWVALLALALMALPLVAGCSGEPALGVDPKTSAVTVGEAVELKAYYDNGGVGGCIAGPKDVTSETIWMVEGRRVPYPIAFDKPGDYTVNAGYGGTTSWARVVVEEAVSKSVDQADASTLERIFLSGNDAAVSVGGKPVSFTLTETRRIRSIGTYHWNDAKGTSGGGTITLKSEAGKVVGEWKVTRTGEGQGGVPNAYWYVDIDVKLPAGTYTIHDSDPGTWAQNSLTGGLGHAWVDAERK